MITIRYSDESDLTRMGLTEVRLHITDGPDLEFTAQSVYRKEWESDQEELAIFKTYPSKKNALDLAVGECKLVAYARHGLDCRAEVYSSKVTGYELSKFFGTGFMAKELMKSAGFDYVTRIE